MSTSADDLDSTSEPNSDVFYDRSDVLLNLCFGSDVTLHCHVKSDVAYVIWAYHPNHQESVAATSTDVSKSYDKYSDELEQV